MTPEEESLAKVIGLLESLGIPYMVAGSLASSHHGRPRTTHDADLVIEPTSSALEALVAALTDAGFYVDAERSRDAFLRRRFFNAIDETSGYKIDLILRKERRFSVEEFRRRARGELFPGFTVSVATAEDTILSKLEWSALAGGSEKQLEDVAGVLTVRKDLDLGYIEHWARELGVLDSWRSVSQKQP